MFEKDTIKKRSTVTAQELFGFGQEDYEELDLPELGGVVYIRQLSAREVLEFANAINDEGITAVEKTTAQNDIVARALVNENGARIIPPGQEDNLADIPMKLYLKLINAVTAGMTEITGTDLVAEVGEKALEDREAQRREEAARRGQ